MNQRVVSDFGIVFHLFRIIPHKHDFREGKTCNTLIFSKLKDAGRLEFSIQIETIEICWYAVNFWCHFVSLRLRLIPYNGLCLCLWTL